MEHEAQFSPRPFLTLDDLGYLYLSLNQPENALRAFDGAARSTPGALRAADHGFFEFKVAQGQSAAWSALGNLEKATDLPGEGSSIFSRMFRSHGGDWPSLYELHGTECGCELVPANMRRS